MWKYWKYQYFRVTLTGKIWLLTHSALSSTNMHEPGQYTLSVTNALKVYRKAVTLCDLNKSLQDELKAMETKSKIPTLCLYWSFFFSSLTMAARTENCIACVSKIVKTKQLPNNSVIVNAHINQRTDALRLNYLSVLFVVLFLLNPLLSSTCTDVISPLERQEFRSFPKGSAGKLWIAF